MSYVGKITAGGVTSPVASTLYGTCDTEANVAAKEVVCPDFDQLIEGVTIHVKFTNDNKHTSPTLNVNSTGAKTISGGLICSAGSVVSFTYDGSKWCMNNNGIDLIYNGIIGNPEGFTFTAYAYVSYIIFATKPVGQNRLWLIHAYYPNGGPVKFKDLLSSDDPVIVSSSTVNGLTGSITVKNTDTYPLFTKIFAIPLYYSS